MGRLIPRGLDTKFQHILSQERSLAKAVASAVIEAKPVGVWEVLIPILFLFHLLDFKRSRETFALNFMFTKKLALEAAFEMVDRGKDRETVRERIREKTESILAGDKKGLYSSKIRQKQMKEIDLLIPHYQNLLEAEGKNFPTMVKNGYQSRERYAAFLEELEEAEKDVYQAANQTVKTTSAREITAKMEAAARAYREGEIRRIFG